MENKQKIAVAIAIFFVIKMVAGVNPPAPSSVQAAANASQPIEQNSRWQKTKFAVGHSTSARKASFSGENVVLQRKSDGHFYADASVQGSSIRFLIDTGASGIALTGDDAQALGLSWSEDELEMVGRGVSGPVMGKMVVLGSVQIGRFHVSNIEASIIPEGLDVSLLGQSFLSHVGNVNIADDQMTLR
jgi:aspartyl protease family protein